MTPPHPGPPGIDPPPTAAPQPATDPPLGPRVVSCRSTPEFLAALPLLLGFTPRDSLVAVCFAGRRSAQAIRLDLPPDDAPASLARTVSTLCAALDSLRTGSGGGPSARAAEPRAVALTIVTSQTFRGRPTPPWVPLADRAAQAVRAAGWEVRELCCLAPDAWASYQDPRPPRGGHPLQEISATPVALAAALRGDTVPEYAELGAIPAPDPARATAISTLLAAAAPPEFAGLPAPDDPAAVGVVGHLLRRPTRPHPREVAHLIRTLGHTRQWLGVLTGIMISPDHALALLRGSQSGPQLHRLGTPSFSTNPAELPELRAFLASVAPEFTERHRLGVVRDRLCGAIAECPDPDRVPLYTLSAWVWWLAGTQGVAQRHIDAARALDAQHPLVRCVEQLIRVPSHISPAIAAAADAR